MSPGGHLVTTAIACGAAYGITGSASLTAGLAAGGFFVDVDHAFDYVVFERQRDLRPATFLRYYLGGEVKRAVLLLHSYEVAALLTLVALVTGWEWLWGYVFGFAALHLPLDIVFNGKLQPRGLVPFYSLVYRWRAGFRTSILLGPSQIAPASRRFWTAFFKGAVVMNEDPRMQRGQTQPAGPPTSRARLSRRASRLSQRTNEKQPSESEGAGERSPSEASPKKALHRPLTGFARLACRLRLALPRRSMRRDRFE